MPTPMWRRRPAARRSARRLFARMPYVCGEPRSGVARAGTDHPGRRGRHGAQRDHHPVASPADLRQAGDLPADGSGAAGDVAVRRSGRAALADAPAVSAGAAGLTMTISLIRSKLRGAAGGCGVRAGRRRGRRATSCAWEHRHPLHREGFAPTCYRCHRRQCANSRTM